MKAHRFLVKFILFNSENSKLRYDSYTQMLLDYYYYYSYDWEIAKKIA